MVYSTIYGIPLQRETSKQKKCAAKMKKANRIAGLLTYRIAPFDASKE
jgi:hypothetical protein